MNENIDIVGVNKEISVEKQAAIIAVAMHLNEVDELAKEYDISVMFTVTF